MPRQVVDKHPLTGEKITFIEAKIPEEVLLQAETLLDGENPIAPRALSDHNYETVIEDNGLRYTTQISIENEIILSQQCNCVQWSNHILCRHIAACLIRIRKIKEEKEVEKKAQTRKKRTRRKNVTEQLIARVPQKEIVEFIEYYQKKDKTFKLLLQGHFATHLSYEEIENLIESAFPVLTKANEKITPARINLFIKVADSLDDHFKNYISQEDYRKGYEINHLLLKKSFYIKSKLTSENSKFLQHHARLIANFIETLHLVEAPEYREVIYTQLANLLATSYISANTVEEQMIWMALYQEPIQKDALPDIIATYWKYEDDDLDSNYFIRALELLLFESKRSESIAQLDPQACYRILKIIATYKGLIAAQEVMSDMYCIKKLQYPLTKLILSSISNPTLDFIRKTGDYYLLYKKEIYISWLQKHAPDWQKVSTEIEEKLDAQGDMFCKVQFLIAIGKLEEASDLLLDEEDFDLIKQFDYRISKSHPKLAYKMYTSHLQTYLSTHFGSKATEYGEMVINRSTVTLGKLQSDKIKAFLAKSFPDRKTF